MNDHRDTLGFINKTPIAPRAGKDLTICHHKCTFPVRQTITPHSGEFVACVASQCAKTITNKINHITFVTVATGNRYARPTLVDIVGEDTFEMNEIGYA